MERENELITRKILNEALGKTESGLRTEFRWDIKREVGKVREEMHEMEFRLNNRMDDRFNKIDDVLKQHLDAVRWLADTVEEVVFPQSA